MIRTDTPNETAAPSPIISIYRAGVDVHPGFEPHSHIEPMLVWSSTATVTVTTRSRDWLVPPGYGIWVPAEVEHGAATLHPGEVGVVQIDPETCPITWTEPTSIEMGPLLYELVVHLDTTGPDTPGRQHAMALVLDLLTPLPANAVNLAMPADPRAREVAERLVADPADDRDLADWALEVHAGVRTLSRRFREGTGMSFAQWRTQLRIRAAADLLVAGESVGAAARAVGYRKTSAFIDAFRRVTGHTPGAYLKAGE